MPEITSGRVVYARTVQPAQYESKRVEAELSFVVAAGEDPAAALAEVGALVRTGALELVGARGDEEASRPVTRSGRRFSRRSDPDD